MGVIFAPESIENIWLEVRDLIKAHNDEVGFLGDEHFDPSLERYKACEPYSKLYTARIESDGPSVPGRLVGYANFFVSPHHHYQKTVWAIQDALFVAKDFRGTAAIRFIEWTDGELKAAGCSVVYRHVTVKKDYQRVLEYLGYGLVEAGYAKRL